MDWIKAHKIAETMLREIVLAERPHWRKKAGYKSYNVYFGGKILGQVEHGDETIERKPRGCRYTMGSRTRKRWCYSNPELRSAGLYYESRKRAVTELLQHLLTNDKLKVAKNHG